MAVFKYRTLEDYVLNLFVKEKKAMIYFYLTLL